MTAVQIPWAPGALYTKITCRLGQARPDGLDQDANPDLMTQAGIVRLSCSAKRIKYTEEDGRARMLTTGEWVFKIRASDGELYTETQGPEGSGTVGVLILSGESAGVNPSHFTWKATVTPVNGEGWSVDIPSTSDSTFDLVQAANPELNSTPTGVQVTRTSDGVLAIGSASLTSAGAVTLGG